MAHTPDDLGEIEVALLGVLCLGLPPSKAAGSDTFRVDHVTAVATGLANEGRRDLHLAPDGVAVTAEFRAALRAAIDTLMGKEVLAYQPAGMPAAAGGFEAGLEIDLVNPDEQPAVLDRYLAQLCMERLFSVSTVYPYLMERYAASGEVWRRIREGGYQQ